MSALVNGVGGVVILGLAALGSYGIYVLVNPEPKSHTLSSGETGIATYTENSQLGGIEANKKVLVADIEKNKHWFNWAYTNWLNPKTSAKSSNIDSAFNSVTKGYGIENSDNTTALNKVCDSFYKKGKSDFDNDTDNKKKNSVSEFCTVGGNKNIEIPKS